MLNKIAEKYNLIHQTKAESINIDKIEAFSLYYRIENESFSVSIIDDSRGKCLLYEFYLIHTDFENSINEIIDQHYLLKAGFWKKIRISVTNNSFSMVPNSLFEKEKIELYLSQTDTYGDSNYEAKAYKHLSLNAVNVFHIEKSKLLLFKNLYPNSNLEYVHDSSAFIEGVFREQSSEEDNVFINFNKTSFTLAVIINSKLIYCNSFNFKTNKDIVYYILFSLRELDLDTESLSLKVWGEIDHNSELFELIYKYIRFVYFGKRPKYINFSYHFDEVIEHKSFTLFSQHLCE